VDAEGYAQTMQTLAILEASATAMAAPYVTKKDIKTARKINEDMVASLEELDPVMFSVRAIPGSPGRSRAHRAD
jgi:DNA-binding GntR family transcriptional regulator